MDRGILAAIAVVVVLVLARLLFRQRANFAAVPTTVVGAVLVGAVLGSAGTAAGFVAWGSAHDNLQVLSDRTVFRSIPMPNQEPPGLADVRFQDSPTNGLEMYFQQGQEVFMACVAMPDQLAVGSCKDPDAVPVRTAPVADGRTLTIARLDLLDEERAKTTASISVADAVKYWSTVELSADPAWLEKWI